MTNNCHCGGASDFTIISKFMIEPCVEVLEDKDKGIPRNNMPEILFVCSANRIRSPLCEAFCKQYLNEKGISGWTIRSVGTWVPGKTGAHPLAISQGKRFSLDLSNHISCEVTGNMIGLADLVIVMTQSQKEALQIEFSDHSAKVFLLSEITDGSKVDVPDPIRYSVEEMDLFTEELREDTRKATENLIKKFSDQ